mmetsp:Transcript_13793/g.51463  ORF Transcript_13793/g.51463 Transcript_13793/m.51463 type:complete len:200 (-) Transcript_13793:426-1025(-)
MAAAKMAKHSKGHRTKNMSRLRRPGRRGNADGPRSLGQLTRWKRPRGRLEDPSEERAHEPVQNSQTPRRLQNLQNPQRFQNLQQPQMPSLVERRPRTLHLVQRWAPMPHRVRRRRKAAARRLRCAGANERDQSRIISRRAWPTKCACAGSRHQWAPSSLFRWGREHFIPEKCVKRCGNRIRRLRYNLQVSSFLPLSLAS